MKRDMPMTEEEFRRCLDIMSDGRGFLTELQIQFLYTIYFANHVDFDAVWERIQNKEQHSESTRQNKESQKLFSLLDPCRLIANSNSTYPSSKEIGNV